MNQLRDLVAVRLQGEVSGIKEMDVHIRNVAFVRGGTGCHEDGVVLAPYDRVAGLCSRK